MGKGRIKPLQNTKIKQLTGINKPVRVNKVKSARRLLANLIYLYQKGDITSDYIRTLTYVLMKYQEICKTEILENLDERIKKLEENGKNEKSKKLH